MPENQKVFNRDVLNLHKQYASSLSNSSEYDYFRSEIATKVISRILDLDREHPIALDLGCHSGQIYKELINFIRQNPTDKLPGGIKQFYQLETCQELLFRDEMPDWQNQLIETKRIHHSDMDATPLPFDDNTFDLVVSSMSLQWINDIPFLFREVNRILKSDGAFIGAFSGGDTLQELRSSLLLADQERMGGMNNHMSPFVTVSDVGNLLSKCGFVMVTVDNEVIQIPYPNMFVLMEHIGSMGDSHCPIQMDMKHISKDTFLAAAACYDAMYCDSPEIEIEKRNELNEYSGKNELDADSSIDATMQIIYFICWTKHDSQRKPMERGTADVSLRDFEEITDIMNKTDDQSNNGDVDDDKKQ